MKTTVDEVLDIVSKEVLNNKAVSLDSNLEKEFNLDHLDMRDIVFYLEDELGLVNDSLWEAENLIVSFKTLRELLDSYDYEIEGL